MHRTRFTSPYIYTVIAAKFATYYELLHKYDAGDFVALYEMVLVSMYNRAAVLETQKNTKR